MSESISTAYRINGDAAFRADAKLVLALHKDASDAEFFLRKCAAKHFGAVPSEVQVTCLVSGARVMVAFPVRRPNLTTTRVVFI